MVSFFKFVVTLFNSLRSKRELLEFNSIKELKGCLLLPIRMIRRVVDCLNLSRVLLLKIKKKWPTITA